MATLFTLTPAGIGEVYVGCSVIIDSNKIGEIQIYSAEITESDLVIGRAHFGLDAWDTLLSKIPTGELPVMAEIIKIDRNYLHLSVNDVAI